MDPRGQCCSTPVYLPGGWEVRWDTTAGRPYYLDHNTKQTSWDRPAPPPDLHDQLPRPRQIQAILPTGWEERRDLGSDEAGSPHEDATDDEDDLDDELAAMSENDEPLRKKYGRRNVTQHPAIVAAAAAATAAAAKGTQCPVVRGGLAVRTTTHVQLAHVARPSPVRPPVRPPVWPPEPVPPLLPPLKEPPQLALLDGQRWARLMHHRKSRYRSRCQQRSRHRQRLCAGAFAPPLPGFHWLLEPVSLLAWTPCSRLGIFFSYSHAF